jgi:glucose/arabinose dehydrogenase
MRLPFMYTTAIVLALLLVSACAPTPPPPAATPPAAIAPTATTQSATTTQPPATATALTEAEPTAPSQAAAPVSAAFPPRIQLEPAFAGFVKPVYLTHAGDPTQLYVVEQAGRIQLIVNGQTQPEPFLDITDRVGADASERGLLSVAFPPDYTESLQFYVNYTDRRGDTVIARFRRLADDPRRADPASEEQILQIAQPAPNHNGGQLQFGPDGALYIGMGDGGRAGDPWGNAQNLQALLGKLLRIQVTGVATYTIPADNPFVGQAADAARPEIWASGLRNPWRFSFDRATGDLYIADVGQNQYEEVNFQPADSRGGENYGWNVMEGAHCYKPPAACGAQGLTLPIAEYDHSQGCSITGGYVYRGASFPQLVGVYFFGDFCSGRIWGARQAADGTWQTADLLQQPLAISSFGEDAAGELYVLDYGRGEVLHIVAQP